MMKYPIGMQSFDQIRPDFIVETPCISLSSSSMAVLIADYALSVNKGEMTSITIPAASLFDKYRKEPQSLLQVIGFLSGSEE